MAQTWKINGQVYTHGQLMELRKQGLDPRRDQIILSAVTPRNGEGKVDEGPGTETKKAKKAKEPKVHLCPVCEKDFTGQDHDESHPEEGTNTDPDGTPTLPTNFMQLKALAKEKGMEVTKDTKKEDIVAFLDKQNAA